MGGTAQHRVSTGLVRICRSCRSASTRGQPFRLYTVSGSSLPSWRLGEDEMMLGQEAGVRLLSTVDEIQHNLGNPFVLLG